MKKYLITGAAGFIGANFVKHLIEAYGNDVEIVIVDALTYAGNLQTISEEIARDNVTFVKGDIGDAALIDRLLAEHDPDFVVNFAAESHVDRSITNPRLFLETNILGTQTLLDACRRAWLTGTDDARRPVYREGKRFLQISTDEVYGALPKEYDIPQPLTLGEEVARVAAGRNSLVCYGVTMFTETTPLSPRSPYSASKASADMLTEAYRETYAMPVLITRCSNNYGPCQFPEKLIPLIIKNILEGRKIPVYGRGENVRDWLYVDDHARAIDLVLRRGRLGEVYNIGGFNEASNIDIVRRVISTVASLVASEPAYRALSKLDAADINDSLIEFVTDRPGHDMRYAIDPTKIATELGWYPATPFDEGIVKTVRWYLDNREWVDSVTSGEYQSYYSRMYENR